MNEETERAANMTAHDNQDCECKDSENLAIASNEPKKCLHEKRELPFWGLPTEFQKLVIEVSESNNAPRDYCVSALVGTVAAIIRKGVQLTYGNYKNYPSLWQIFVGNSTRGKSPTFDWFWQPLMDWRNEKNNEFDRCMAEWRHNGRQGTSPSPQDFVVQDMSAEARNYAMKRNQEQGAAALIDEADTFFGCLGRYNGTIAKEIADLNSVYTFRPITIDRKDVENRMTINEPCINFMCGVQDDHLPELFGNQTMMSTGFIQRFMFVCPEKQKRSRNKAVISDNTVKGWKEYTNYLLTKFSGNFIKREDMELEPAAMVAFDNYSNELADKEDDSETSFEIAIYAKHRFFVLRWATIVAYLNVHCNVTEQDMLYSIECMRYFEKCALLVYDMIKPRRGTSRKMTGPELIRELQNEYGTLNQSKLAEAIHKTQPFVNQCLNPKSK